MNKKIKSALVSVVMVIAIGIAICVGVSATKNLTSSLEEYEVAKEEYSELSEKAEVKEKEPVKEEKKDVLEGFHKIPEVDKTIDLDYEGLKEENEAFACWLYYEPLGLSLPVVSDDKGGGYYEHYTFSGEKNSSGCLYLDGACSTKMKSVNSVIYGHSMRNGSMFGNLKKVDEDMVAEEPYFYLFSEGFSVQYKIVLVCKVKATSDSYDLRSGGTEKERAMFYDYLAGLEEKASYFDGEYFDGKRKDSKYATLSTCAGHNTGIRTVVVGVEIARDDFE